jgi:hypothetical protein
MEPIGRGTPDVESLLSYFCRLAVSHSVTTTTLAKTVVKQLGCELHSDFKFHERNLSGLSEVAQTWSSALSALTSISHLDLLTLSPWKDVVAPIELATNRARWCPECFEEDRASEKPPYFRLAWEVKPVSACLKHRTCLVDVCPECGRSGVRHASAYVVPGWCTQCGAFLGKSRQAEVVGPTIPATPEALWRARQIGLLLAEQHDLMARPSRSGLRDAIYEVIRQLDHGNSAAFARRVGLGKATVHNWIKDGGLPSLSALLLISAHSGLALRHLLTGQIQNWAPPKLSNQLELALLHPREAKRETPREHDWGCIQEQLRDFLKLPEPISLAEAARRLDIEARLLYLRANRESRMLGERWKSFRKSRGEARLERARPYLLAACRDIMANGLSVSFREVASRVPADVLLSVDGLFEELQTIQMEIQMSS